MYLLKKTETGKILLLKNRKSVFILCCPELLAVLYLTMQSCPTQSSTLKLIHKKAPQICSGGLFCDWFEFYLISGKVSSSFLGSMQRHNNREGQNEADYAQRY